MLAVDIGNSNVTLGLYRDKTLVAHWRLATDRQATSDQYGLTIGGLMARYGASPEEGVPVIVSSVVPPLNRAFAEMAQDYFATTARFVGQDVAVPMRLLVDSPAEVGADRLVNAYAVWRLYGGPAVIVDFGTATTVCGLSRDGCYLGGAIAPGIGIASNALFERAAKLPRVELRDPGRAIGKNTITAMQSGLFYGFVGQVDALVERVLHEVDEEARLIATGGYARLIAPAMSREVTVAPFLTLEGLRLLWEDGDGEVDENVL